MSIAVCPNCKATSAPAGDWMWCPTCGAEFETAANLVADEEDLRIEAAMSEFRVEAGRVVKYTGVSHRPIIPEGVPILGKNLFKESGIERISIPDGVVLIEESAFEGCQLLETVELPPSVTEIHQKAFMGCSNLRNIDLSHVSVIGVAAFYDCGSLSTETISSISASSALAVLEPEYEQKRAQRHEQMQKLAQEHARKKAHEQQQAERVAERQKRELQRAAARQKAENQKRIRSQISSEKSRFNKELAELERRYREGIRQQASIAAAKEYHREYTAIKKQLAVKHMEVIIGLEQQLMKLS